jgi:hypothetical protein
VNICFTCSFPLCLCMLWLYRMTSLVSYCASIVNQNKWPTLLHDRADVTSRYMCKMSLKQRSLNWINYMQVKKILFTNVFFSWSLCLLNMFPSMVFPKHFYLGIGDLSWSWRSYLGPLVYLLAIFFLIIWLSNLSILSVPDEFSSASSKYGSTFICWRHKWRDLVYEYSWAKSPMISGLFQSFSLV